VSTFWIAVEADEEYAGWSYHDRLLSRCLYSAATAAAKCKPLLLCASGAQRGFACVAATTSQPAMYRKQTSQKSYTEKQPIPAYSATSASPEQHKD